MRALLQRVTEASVEADDGWIGRIDRGLVTLVGVAVGDGPDDSRHLADKILHLRIFEDARGRLNDSLLAVRGSCLLVPQFTLCADTRRGRRPDFRQAAVPGVAVPLLAALGQRLGQAGILVVEGRFGARMRVRLTNDGPVTILLDSRGPG
jgi:D-tyrosyl-tRNA(Tyr) deacylase